MIICPADSGGGDDEQVDRYHNGELMADDSLARRRFFFLAKLSRPLSVFESLLSESLDELEPDDDDDDDELDPLELSDAKPVLSFRFTCSATSARAGSFSCVRPGGGKNATLPSTWKMDIVRSERDREGCLTLSTRSHRLDSFGRPRTVLCHTTGKLVLLQKFCVTAIVSSKLMTTCHHPPGTNTVSPGFCRISI